jgi:hypothetical protein
MSHGNLWLPRFVRFLASGFLCLLFSYPSSAQAQATVSFTFDFPGSQPEHYAISVDSDGHAKYESNGKLDPQTEAGDLFRMDLTLSPSTSSRVFDLAKRADYFQGPVDSNRRNLASTGTKVLAYRDAGKSTSATYNYSQISAVQQITALFQNLSTTLEFGRRIEFYRRYQKLALDDELKRMEEMAKQNSLEELSALAPLLQQVASDPTMINPVRVRAQRLIERGASR